MEIHDCTNLPLKAVKALTTSEDIRYGRLKPLLMVLIFHIRYGRLKPLIVGITGATGSGKTYTISKIQSLFGNDLISFISTDQYNIHARDYETLSMYENVGRYDFDSVVRLDDKDLVKTIITYCEKYEYLYNTIMERKQNTLKDSDWYLPARTYAYYGMKVKEENPKLYIRPILIIEGNFSCITNELLNLYDLKFYIFVDYTKSIIRRFERDVKERNVRKNTNCQQYFNSVYETMEQCIIPSAMFVDYILPCYDYNDALYLEVYKVILRHAIAFRSEILYNDIIKSSKLSMTQIPTNTVMKIESLNRSMYCQTYGNTEPMIIVDIDKYLVLPKNLSQMSNDIDQSIVHSLLNYIKKVYEPLVYDLEHCKSTLSKFTSISPIYADMAGPNGCYKISLYDFFGKHFSLFSIKMGEMTSRLQSKYIYNTLMFNKDLSGHEEKTISDFFNKTLFTKIPTIYQETITSYMEIKPSFNEFLNSYDISPDDLSDHINPKRYIPPVEYKGYVVNVGQFWSDFLSNDE